MFKFLIEYENKETNETKQETLILKGIVFYVAIKDSLKNPFFYMPSEVVYKATDLILETGTKVNINAESENYLITIKEL